MRLATPLGITTILLGINLLYGCAPVIVGGAATGASIVHDRRSAGTALEDQTIEFKALHLTTDNKAFYKRANLSATSYNKVVLLTGQAENEQLRQRYVDMIRKIKEVKRVVDEIQIGPSTSLTQQGSDTYITSKVKIKLFDVKLPNFDPTRVKVVTDQGNVYLMGIITKQEANEVVQKVRYVSGVKRVIKIFEYQ
ncbi:MAG: BON domain-containing protein [Gammaproteobacteria bacterium]|nr:BON domain-containing protein [Gammaproteobacteria bacterium]